MVARGYEFYLRALKEYRCRHGNEHDWPIKRELPLHCKVLSCINIILLYYNNIFISNFISS